MRPPPSQDPAALAAWNAALDARAGALERIARGRERLLRAVALMVALFGLWVAAVVLNAMVSAAGLAIGLCFMIFAVCAVTVGFMRLLAQRLEDEP